MKAIAALCDIVPGWLWALLLAGTFIVGGVVVSLYSVRTAGAERDAANALRTLYEERTTHARALAAQTALVLKATNELTAARAVQEKRDGDAQATIAALGEDLRRRSRAAGGAGLRDPFAAAGGCPAGAESGPAAAAGGEDAAPAGRQLSAQLEGFLIERFELADTINAAYASCRQDAIDLRATLRALQPGVP